MSDLILPLHALAVSGAAFLLLWPVSLLRRDASVVDLWWGPGFLSGALTVWLLAGGTDPRSLLILALVALWALRLGGVMAARKLRHREEDRRYRVIRAAWGRSFWWKSLFIVFVLQALLQWLIALAPLTALAAPPAPPGAFAYLGAVIALAGLTLETVADRQLDRFKATAAPGALCDTGLRAHVRHPNYTGEIIFWWGLWLICAPVAPWWVALSPALITFLLAKVSGAPMMREAMQGVRPEFEAYAKRTPAFLPHL